MVVHLYMFADKCIIPLAESSFILRLNLGLRFQDTVCEASSRLQHSFVCFGLTVPICGALEDIINFRECQNEIYFSGQCLSS